jgi:hypothetical protein
MAKWHIDKASAAPVQFFNLDSVQTVASTSFGVGYISGVHAMISGTNTLNPVPNIPVNPPTACIEPKDMAFGEAKKQIRQYFLDHHGENIDYGDLMDALNIRLSLIVDVCEQLEMEGEIAGVN